MEVAFVTSNRGKVEEVKDILSPYGIRVRPRLRVLPEIQSDSLEAVVRAKLTGTRDVPGVVIVEDSGLFIRSLGGFPGVYSAHILRIWGFGPILELLRHRPRSAMFRTVAGLREGTSVRTFAGTCSGSIARAPRGTRGFGYDPIFLPAGFRQTFAEISPVEKNRLSHRARAFRKVGEYLSRESSGSRRER